MTYESQLAQAENRQDVFSKTFLRESNKKGVPDESFRHETAWHSDRYRESCDCVEPWDRHRSDHRGGHRELLQRQVARKKDRQRRSVRQKQTDRIAQNASLRNQGQGDKS